MTMTMTMTITTNMATPTSMLRSRHLLRHLMQPLMLKVKLLISSLQPSAKDLKMLSLRRRQLSLSRKKSSEMLTKVQPLKPSKLLLLSKPKSFPTSTPSSPRNLNGLTSTSGTSSGTLLTSSYTPSTSLTKLTAPTLATRLDMPSLNTLNGRRQSSSKLSGKSERNLEMD